jgi:hypothetical protein
MTSAAKGPARALGLIHVTQRAHSCRFGLRPNSRYVPAQLPVVGEDGATEGTGLPERCFSRVTHILRSGDVASGSLDPSPRHFAADEGRLRSLLSSVMLVVTVDMGRTIHSQRYAPPLSLFEVSGQAARGA